MQVITYAERHKDTL